MSEGDGQQGRTRAGTDRDRLKRREAVLAEIDEWLDDVRDDWPDADIPTVVLDPITLPEPKPEPERKPPPDSVRARTSRCSSPLLPSRAGTVRR